MAFLATVSQISGDSTNKTGSVTQKCVFQCEFWYFSCLARVIRVCMDLKFAETHLLSFFVSRSRSNKNTGKDNRRVFNTLIHIIYNFSKEKGKLFSIEFYIDLNTNSYIALWLPVVSTTVFMSSTELWKGRKKKVRLCFHGVVVNGFQSLTMRI